MYYLAAAVMTAIYLYNLPLELAVVWRGYRWGVGIGAFEDGAALKRARSKAAEVRKKKRRRQPDARRVIRLTAAMISHTQLGFFSARLRVGTGDAAGTALICGALTAIAEVFRQAARAGRVDIRPDFSEKCIEGELAGVFRFKAGRLFGASAMEYVNRG